MREQQFNEYMSIYSIQQIRKVLILQQDRDTLQLEAQKNEIIRSHNPKESTLHDLTERLSAITKTEDLIFKLSNPYMTMNTTSEMVLPIKEKWVKVLILVKTLTALNRFYKHNNQDAPVITEDTLNELGYSMDIDSLEKVLNALQDVRINRIDDGLELDFNNIWADLPSRGAGYIQYDMSTYQNQIDKAYSYMEDVYMQFNPKDDEILA